MSLVSTVIADIRVEINDTESTRFTNDTAVILPLVKQAIRRANRIVQRVGLHFGKKKVTVTTTANQAYSTLTADLDIPLGLYRDSDHTKIWQLGEDEWEQTETASELTYWFLDIENSKFLWNGTPTTARSLTFWYYPTVDPSAYTTSSTMPWGGRLDDIIAKYVALRIQNLEEMNIKVDENILKDMEVSIIEAYMPQNPTSLQGSGWL
jgi:hypothetical protein